MLTDPRRPGQRPRTVRPGTSADLCLLQRNLDQTVQAISQATYNPVRATFLSGRCFWAAETETDVRSRRDPKPTERSSGPCRTLYPPTRVLPRDAAGNLLHRDGMVDIVA
jgi:hypothetical protein